MSKRSHPVHWSQRLLRRLHNPFSDVSQRHLHNYDMELRQMLGAVDAERSRLILAQSLVHEAQRNAEDTQSITITDHAIVRYLERYEGMDMTRIEDAILAMARDGRPEVAMRNGLIVTLLPEGDVAENRDDENSC